ncbi:Kelch repeat-containing protein [Alteromonas facilis]|uniref:Kelch repeat-containing protein n=1 Tax=Alteromonas facilis TaxID=2048004 RepID=UPI000C2841EE|nr:kelch repeat-containing protein [Alteromonas facilis]
MVKPRRGVWAALMLTCGLVSASQAFGETLSESASKADSNTQSESTHWQVAAALPIATQEIYPALHDGKLVVAGGLTPSATAEWMGVSDRVFAYSFDVDEWVEWPSLPEPRHHPMLIDLEQGLYSFGGFTQNDKGLWHNSTDVLKLTDSGKWQTISSMPIPLSESLISVHNGVVHLVTGRTPLEANNNAQWRDHGDTAQHWMYDIESNRWAQGASAPTARNSACAVVIDNRWHTIGGRTVGGGNLAVHEVYDFTTQQWQTLPSLPQAQAGLACAAIGKQIYVFGGEYFDNGGGVYETVWQYDTQQALWREASVMPLPRHGLGAITHQQKIYVVAGAAKAGGNETSNRMSIFTPAQ